MAKLVASTNAQLRYLLPFLVFPLPLRLPLLIFSLPTHRQYEAKFPTRRDQTPYSRHGNERDLQRLAKTFEALYPEQGGEKRSSDTRVSIRRPEVRQAAKKMI